MTLLDTSTLIWWTLDPEKLSPRALDACQKMENTGDGGISSISLWEIGLKIKNRQLDIGMSLRDYISRVRRMNLLEIIPVDEEIWAENLELPWKHRDPADRTIVATAKIRGLPLVTIDAEIRKFYERAVW